MYVLKIVLIRYFYVRIENSFNSVFFYVRIENSFNSIFFYVRIENVLLQNFCDTHSEKGLLNPNVCYESSLKNAEDSKL